MTVFLNILWIFVFSPIFKMRFLSSKGLAWLEEPARSLMVVMAAAIITEYLGWAAGALGAFLTTGAGADMMMFWGLVFV